MVSQMSIATGGIDYYVFSGGSSYLDTNSTLTYFVYPALYSLTLSNAGIEDTIPVQAAAQPDAILIDADHELGLDSGSGGSSSSDGSNGSTSGDSLTSTDAGSSQTLDVSRYESQALAAAVDFVNTCGSVKDAANLTASCPTEVRSTSLYWLKTTQTPTKIVSTSGSRFTTDEAVIEVQEIATDANPNPPRINLRFTVTGTMTMDSSGQPSFALSYSYAS